MPVVLTLGTFDIPHAGHQAFLRRSAEYGDLIVGVNSDAFVAQYKGKRCVYDQYERMALIEEMGYEARLNDGPGRVLVSQVLPKIITISTDWMFPKDYLNQIGIQEDYLRYRDIHIVFIPHTSGISTTNIIDRVRGSGHECKAGYIQADPYVVGLENGLTICMYCGVEMNEESDVRNA